MYRNTYVEIDLDNLSYNVKNIIKKYNYKYYIGMVKSNAYNHGYKIVDTLVESGINYLAVSNIDEAIEIRKYNEDIPILITEIIDSDLIEVAIKNNITLTVDSLDYLKKIKSKCRVHIKLNTGMNRLGVSSRKEFNILYDYISNSNNISLEGIYTHFSTPGINDKYYDEQIRKFKEIIKDIDINKIPMIHLSSSFSLLNHPKIDIENAVRLGTIMYGYNVSLNEYGNDIRSKIKKIRDNYLIKKYNISPVLRGNHIEVKPAFKIKTNVMEVRKVKKGDILGYGSKVLEDTKVAVLPIGYDSGIGDNINDRYVLINNKKYKCIGSICMCMMFVSVDDSVKVGDSVTILGDELTLGYMSRLNNSHIQKTLTTVGVNLRKVYTKNGKVVSDIWQKIL